MIKHKISTDQKHPVATELLNSVTTQQVSPKVTWQQISKFGIFTYIFWSSQLKKAI
jgi:hypothetical protein